MSFLCGSFSNSEIHSGSLVGLNELLILLITGKNAKPIAFSLGISMYILFLTLLSSPLLKFLFSISLILLAIASSYLWRSFSSVTLVGIITSLPEIVTLFFSLRTLFTALSYFP
ncbi:hypothetical protein JOY27_02845 [Mycoplasmopsis bovis]|nr:hypothetical protein [Mycoplasmopsis bovis]QRF86342.1 hypothetical protein JN825_02575 [Mycoplasmopsis bovis]QRF88045.1 hypothetical protein JOY27_02845 [Mycoplasmopsis bovis]